MQISVYMARDGEKCNSARFVQQHYVTKEQTKEAELTNSHEKRILRVLDHIHANPAGDLSLDALADVAAMSRFHWHRVFVAVTGETLAKAVRRLRLARASMALVHSRDPVEAIAASVGYPNTASFRRAFTESYQMTPAAFRAKGVARAPRLLIRNTKETTMHEISIRNEPARKLIAMPHKGGYHEIGHAFGKLSAIMGTRGLFPHAGSMAAVFYDDPMATPVAELRSHAAFEMLRPADIAAPLELVQLPAGRHAVLILKGPYTGLPAAYMQLYREWLPASGEEPADNPSFEIYRNAPTDTAPEDLITEICVPLIG